jgi:hypothetical protein
MYFAKKKPKPRKPKKKPDEQPKPFVGESPAVSPDSDTFPVPVADDCPPAETPEVATPVETPEAPPHEIEVPVPADHPALSQEPASVIHVAVPVADVDASPLPAPVGPLYGNFRPFTPWLGLGTPAFLFTPDEIPSELQDMPPEGVRAGVNLVPPGE